MVYAHFFYYVSFPCFIVPSKKFNNFMGFVKIARDLARTKSRPRSNSLMFLF
jgi:hypothetical protein